MFLPHAMEAAHVQSKAHPVVRNGRNQAVRIPVEFELPGDEAIMHRDGDRLVIEPVRKRGLIALLKSMTPVDPRATAPSFRYLHLP
jgi:virulence-associated protein VagC